jgi:dolichol-phosphate mannosyltransferase
LEKLIIIPTYNEMENIEKMVHTVFSLNEGFHILVIDDNSPDGTASKVIELQQQYKGQLMLEQRTGKLGLGTAYIHGFKWALAKGYNYIFEMDADFSHNPKHLNRLYEAAKQGYDVVVGSRYIKGGKVMNWPWDRIFLSKGASLYTRMITWMPVKDPTAGFVCYSNKMLSALNFDAIKFSGYAFQIEMKFSAWKLGFKIKEVPITFIDRQFGVSKMNKNIVKEGILGVLQIQYKSFFSDYKKNLRRG